MKDNICDSPGHKRDCWMRCLLLSPPCAPMLSSNVCARSYTVLLGSERPIQRQISPANCALISATGWAGLYFLQRFGFGGCLADDMGLGKTVQVLALLESRRELRAGNENNSLRSSLVVVPRSLVFHWKAEAARFAPKL